MAIYEVKLNKSEFYDKPVEKVLITTDVTLHQLLELERSGFISQSFADGMIRGQIDPSNFNMALVSEVFYVAYLAQNRGSKEIIPKYEFDERLNANLQSMLALYYEMMVGTITDGEEVGLNAVVGKTIEEVQELPVIDDDGFSEPIDNIVRDYESPN